MRRIFVLTIVVALGGLSCCQQPSGAGDSADHRLKNRRSAFILRKCIATAELHKRIGSHNAATPMPKQESEETRMKNLPSWTRVNEGTVIDTSRQRIAFEAGESEPEVKKHVNLLKNTPLTTVDIKTLKNRSPVFRKKSLLPELERSISSRMPMPSEPSQNIILIKPVN